MNETDPTSPASSGPLPTVDEAVRPVCTPEEVSAGKVLSILSYVLNFIRIPFFLVPLIMRNDRFSLYHAKQCLGLWLAFLATGVVIWGFTLITCGIGGIIGIPCFGLLIVGAIVLDIIGLVHAVNGECKPMPIVGGYSERWFKGITAIKGGSVS
ncbi:MAG: hypothetical protein QM783_04405 [Phycisphaerales bacterium]